MSQTSQKTVGATQRFGVGAIIGAGVGGCGGALLALLTVGSRALKWYKAQPPDWSIVTGFCAIVFVLFAVLIIAVIGALVCGFVGGLGSALFSGARPAVKK